MKNIIYAFILLILFTSCNKTDNQLELELELRKKELALKEKELALKIEEKNERDSLRDLNTRFSSSDLSSEENTVTKPSKTDVITKYFYLRYKVIQPVIRKTDVLYDSGLSMDGDKLRFDVPRYNPGKTEIIMEKSTYTSDIITVSPYTPDNEYRMIENYRKTINMKLSLLRPEMIDISQKLKNDIMDGKYHGEILDEQIYAFDTFKAASEHKRNNDQ